MSYNADRQDESSWLYEEVRLPDQLEPGRYDAYGNCDPEGNLFIGEGGNICLPDSIAAGIYDETGRKENPGRIYIAISGTAFIWGLFGTRLASGQRGELTFTNVPGSFLVGTTFTEWNERAQEPVVGDALLTLIASERGEATIRISGRNTSNQSIWAAAGIVVGDNAPY